MRNFFKKKFFFSKRHRVKLLGLLLFFSSIFSDIIEYNYVQANTYKQTLLLKTDYPLVFLQKNLMFQEYTINLSYLSQHWIQSEMEGSGDTIMFRPEGHELLREAPPYLLYGGWTFFPEGQVHMHRWQKCGNDKGAPYRSGSWKRKGNTLKIKIGKEQFIYQVLQLEKDLFKVIVLHPKS